jgi:invasion protein IalB
MKRELISCGVLIGGIGLIAVTLPGVDVLFAAPLSLGEVYAQASPPGSATEKKSTAAPTAPTAQPAPAGPGWAVNCKSEANEKGLECRMSQTVVIKQSGQVLTNVTFRIPVDTKTPEIIVQLPLGVLLTAGATFQVDDNAAQRLNFRACDRNGCYANSSVSPDVLATLRKGTQLKIGFQNLAEKPITVPLSLDGFGEGYEKMEKPS